MERNGVGVKRRIRHEVITCHRKDVRVRNKMSKKGSMELAAKRYSHNKVVGMRIDCNKSGSNALGLQKKGDC